MNAFSLKSAGMICTMALLCAVASGCREPQAVHRFEFEVMGTVASGRIQGKEGPRAARLVQATFDSVNDRLSSWRDDSEVGRFNSADAGTSFTTSAWLDTCLRVSAELARASNGAFDPSAGPLMRVWGFHRKRAHLPSPAELDSALALLGGFEFDPANGRLTKTRAGTRLDFGGIAKGLAVDLAVAHLRSLGVGGALIDLGGNIYALGRPAGRGTWTIGIRDPRDRGRVAASVSLRDRAVATSGSYERFVMIDGHRYGHIMNPATGRPAEGLLSATVICSSATLADGLSTTLFVLGPEEAVALLRDHYPEVDAVLVLPGSGRNEARVLATAGLEADLSIHADYRDRYTLEFLPQR